MPPQLRLLDLELGQPIAFWACPARTALPDPASSRLGEGAEELFLLEEGCVLTTDDGPRFRLPAGTTLDHLVGGKARPEATEQPTYRIGAGVWLFLQWRPRNMDELEEGIEWFLREAWWQGRPAEGPLLLRLVGEDGKTAWQLLRSLSSQA